MVVVPAGSFTMGAAPTESARLFGEVPQHTVTIEIPFAVSKFELTFADWDACVLGGGCNGYTPSDQGWGRGPQPVMNVNWTDAQQYAAWFSKITGKTYRLLSEAEYEYAARARTLTSYPWGDDIKLNGTAMANCKDCGSQWADRRQTAPVGSFPPNKFGLYDMVGNVWEWVEDCHHLGYEITTPRGKLEAPTDGSAWLADADCTNNRVVRAGSWANHPDNIYSAQRDTAPIVNRNDNVGFRVARTLLTP
jgi:formylglycine-generating enzyme required for sulfatase activity